MSVSTVVFDFGNVLAFFSHQKAAKQLAAYGDVAPEAIQAYVFGGQMEDDLETGSLAPEVFRGMVRETWHLSCDDAQFDTAFADMFTPNAEVCALPALLKPRYQVILLSNTNDFHARHFLREYTEVLASFDALVLSHEVHLRKPDSRIYEHCRRIADRPAEELLFIDDLPTNIEAAREAGWQGIVYRRGDDLRRRLAEAGVLIDYPG